MGNICCMLNPPYENIRDDNLGYLEQELKELKTKHGALERRVLLLQKLLADKCAKNIVFEEKIECLFLEKIGSLTDNQEESGQDQTDGSKVDKDGDGSIEMDHARKDSTPKHLRLIKDNYMVLMESLSVSIAEVVVFLYQEGVVNKFDKEDILSETQNRFSRTRKVLDIVLAQGSRTDAYEALYKAAHDPQLMLWGAADILRPEKAPHDRAINEGWGEETAKKEMAEEERDPNIPQDCVDGVATMEMPDDKEYKALTQQVERMCSRLDSVSEDVEGLKSSWTKSEETKQTDAIAEENEEEIRQEFNSVKEQVEQRMVPLSYRDYITLAALEFIADAEDGPAFQFLVKYHRGNSKWAADIRQDEENELSNKGIASPVPAMKKYVKVCGEHPPYPSDTQFHPVVWIYTGYRNCVLAIEQTRMWLLHEVYKTERESWSWAEIRKCVIADGGVFELTFIDGNRVKFNTLENINPQVQDTIDRARARGKS